MNIPKEVQRISDTVLEIPMTYKEGMRLPARIYANESLMKAIEERERVPINVEEESVDMLLFNFLQELIR